MCKDNIHGALKLLTNSTSNGILPLSNKALDLLRQKHPKPMESAPKTLSQDSFRPIHPLTYVDINESMAMHGSMLTKGDSGPSGLNADWWRRTLTSRQFGNLSSDLRKAFLNFIKKLCSEELSSTQSLEAFTANRLIKTQV